MESLEQKMEEDAADATGREKTKSARIARYGFSRIEVFPNCNCQLATGPFRHLRHFQKQGSIF